MAAKYSPVIKEVIMFRFVGWLVVTSFALYGLKEFVGRHVVTEKDEIKFSIS